MKSIAALSALLICAAAPAADLHPIVEVQTGYLFGATTHGKWMKAEEAAKAVSDEWTYQIYGLTQLFGSQGRQTESVGRGCVFGRADGFAFAKAKEGHDRPGRAVECVTTEATNRRYNSVSLCRCSARFFKNERDRATKSENRQHPAG